MIADDMCVADSLASVLVPVGAAAPAVSGNALVTFISGCNACMCNGSSAIARLHYMPCIVAALGILASVNAAELILSIPCSIRWCTKGRSTNPELTHLVDHFCCRCSCSAHG